MAITLIGQEVASSKVETQVYTATHRGDGTRLPYMNRSFISFSFGGRRIEDFGLIAVTQGDRIQRDGSSGFENITTTYEVVNGQMYWGTYFQGNTLHLTLATDGMTQRQLDDFLRWFRGGETRELILAEHPNRGIYARIAEPPSLSLLPFENPTSITIQYTTYKTSTTLYRGEIELSFQMDEPFWYAIENIFGHWDETEQIYKDTWIDANGNEINVLDEKRNKDAVKIMLEDGIPFSSMIQDNMLLGNNIVANTGNEGGAIIAQDSFVFKFERYIGGGENDFIARYYIVEYMKLSEPGNPVSAIIPVLSEQETYSVTFDEEYTEFADEIEVQDFSLIFGYSADSPITVEQVKATVNYYLNLSINGTYITNQWDDPDTRTHVHDNEQYATRIQGVYMTESGGIEELPYGTNTVDKYYFYYAGTAPAYPILEFELEPKFNEDGYIVSPANSYGHTASTNNPYNTFTIESTDKQELQFTTPNIYTSFNTVISIFNNNQGKNPKDIYSLIQDNVKHYLIRAWAIRILDFCVNTARLINTTEDANETNLNNLMKYVFLDQNSSLSQPSAYFVFDSKNGTALGYFKVRKPSGTLPTTVGGWANYGDFTYFDNEVSNRLKENVGDMIKSKWLVITERNTPDENNLIRAWSDTSETSKLYSHRLYHDFDDKLYHIKLIYNNMYV